MEKISKISLIISIIGILILLVINISESQKIISVEKINAKMIGKNIKVMGKSESVIINENNFTIFKLKDETGEIKVICECPNIKENDNIEIIGRVTEYNGEIEIEAEKIKIYKS